MKNMLGTIKIDETSPPREKTHQMKLDIELDECEFRELKNAIIRVQTYEADSQLFSIILWNYEEFLKTIESYIQAFSINKKWLVDERSIYSNINRTFINLLSSIRSYLDYMDSNICDRFGKESLIRKGFHSFCSYEFDNNFSYRFIYGLRNFAQHRGFPITRISISKYISALDQEKIEVRMVIQISKHEILENHDWKKVTKEIQGLPERIDVIPQISSAIESLKNIHANILGLLLKDLKESANIVIKFSRRVSNNNGNAALFENISLTNGEKPIPTKITQQYLPVELAENILNYIDQKKI